MISPKLTKDETVIFDLYFEKGYTCERIGIMQGLSKQRIQQKKEVVVKKISEILEFLDKGLLERGKVSIITKREQLSPLLQMDPSTAFQFSARTSNAMHYGKIATVADLCKMSNHELREIPSLGKLCLKEITDAVQGVGLSLSTDYSEIEYKEDSHAEPRRD